MNIRKLLKFERVAMALSGVAVMGTFFSVPVNAATNSTASVLETQDVTSADQKQCDVSVEVAGGGFVISIPKKITLDGTLFTAQYEVTVKGDISGTEVVKVVPDEFFDLKQAPKADVRGGVLQTKTEFNMSDLAVMGVDDTTGDPINIGTTATGDVFADGRDIDSDGNADVGKLSAGDWEGVFVFNVSVETVSP